MIVYLSLGSNLGDRMQHLAGAVRALAEIDEATRVTAVSPVYETAPLGPDGAVVSDQDAFLNCIVVVETPLEPDELRGHTSAIEQRMGRRSRERWRPRPIDIDIVLAGDARVQTPSVTVPHPRMHERAFVIRPLLDVAPDIAVPGIGALRARLAAVADQPCTVAAPGRELADAAGLDLS